MKKVLLIMKRFFPEYRSQLEALAPELEVVYCEDAPPAAEDLKRAAYIWGNPSGGQLAQCEKLEWLQLQTAGFETYTAPGVLPPGAVLCSCSGAYGLTISEYLVSATLSLMRKLHLYRDLQRAHKWESAGGIMTISRSKILVIGVRNDRN